MDRAVQICQKAEDSALPLESLPRLLEGEIELQKERMVRAARRVVAHVQYDDLLQPQDYPAVDADPEFRFEEGLLYGLERALVLVRRASSPHPISSDKKSDTDRF